MSTRVIKVQAKDIFTRSKLGTKWAINQYVGCEHNCLYCYAKFIQKWRPPEYGKWGSWVEAKINAPELVKDRYVNGEVFMSSISDPYQPVERDLRLTRNVLENLHKEIKLSILTKSNLVLRDIDLFKQFNDIEIGLTVNSFEGKLKEIFEPSSPSNQERIDALKVLKENGFKTYAFVSPIIPSLINLQSIIRATRDFVDYYWFEMINLRGAGKEFSDVLSSEFPKSYSMVREKNRFTGFIKECQEIIAAERIKAHKIVVH